MSGRAPSYLDGTPATYAVFDSLSKSDLYDIAVSFAAQVSESIDNPGGPESLGRLLEEVEALECAGVIPRGARKRITRCESKIVAAMARRAAVGAAEAGRS